ncbi:hypothetical protein [Stackebrandtia soli]|uniref:hypothetical protein n=1 Tax=Stackebrandtia soli TaxID=1892856 RepID=UPI0039EA1584
MSREDEIQLVRQIVSRSDESHEAVIERLGGERTHTILRAALRVAVAFQFPPGTPPEMTRKFAVYAKGRFRHADAKVDVSALEAVLKAAQNGGEPSEVHSPDTLLSMMFLATYAIMSRARLNRKALENYVEHVLIQAGPPADAYTA